MRVHVAAFSVVSLVAFGLSAATAFAQDNYEVLRSLIEPAYPPYGRLLEAANGKLYGVAILAGPAGKGAVLAYDRRPDGTLTDSVLHAFSGPDGETVQAGVIQGSDGALYGTTAEGGPGGGGTVYRLTLDGVLTTLHAFDKTAGPCGPSVELVEHVDGFLYGTTAGICGGEAAIFRVGKSGELTVLHVFGPDAYDPQDALVDGGDGKLYGVTAQGSVPIGSTVALGTFYSITPDGVFTVLRRFVDSGPGFPSTLVDGRDGFFYAATHGWVTSGFPVVYPPAVIRLARSGATTTVATLPWNPGNTLGRLMLIRGADGNFYVTAERGGTGTGILFRVTPAGAVTTLHSFVPSSGSAPTSVIQTSDGALYGSTTEGGVNRRGVVFRSGTGGGYSVANAFSGTDPLLPLASLLEGPDGTLYGTSCLGGLYNAGTIFTVTGTATPTLTVMHSFAYWDGACPRGALTFGHDGALYGATSHSGLGGYGTLFRMTTAGVLAPIFFFNGANGSTPLGGLLYASDGLYYGTTNSGGDPAGGPGLGTVFRWSRSGTFTTLHRFPGSELFASRPVVPLMQASTGDIYGATYLQPFRMTLGGTVTAFNSPGGGGVRGAFEEGLDGNLYNTVGSQGFGPGSIFQVTPAGGPIHLHDFTGPDGSVPYAGLRLAPDGWFYGSTSSGGTNDRGVLFRFSGGALVTLHEFSGPDGAFPASTLMLGADGALYGTTLNGGQGDRGVIFRLRRP